MQVSNLIRASCLAAAVMGVAATAGAQKVVVSHDEWFTNPGNFGSNEQRFVSNISHWFGLGTGNNVLLYSGDTFLTNSTFTDYLHNTLGLNVTTNASALGSTFSSYGAIFVEGNRTYDWAALGNYVRGGGNVVYIGGTGINDAGDEANYSNLFLNQFGFGFAPVYNGLNTVDTHTFAGDGPFGAALFTGVNSVFANNGNDVLSMVTPSTAVTREVFYTDVNETRQGVFGAAAVTTPEPGSLALLGTGLVGLVPMVRRRKRNS